MAPHVVLGYRPCPMLIPFSTEDLNRVFDSRALTRGRSLVLLGSVEVTLDDATIGVTVEHIGQTHTATIQPTSLGHRLVFINKCTCGQAGCAHMAAGALAALDRFPKLRKAAPKTALDRLSAPARAPAQVAERQRLVFDLAPGIPPHACFVTAIMIGERSNREDPTTPKRILADRAHSETSRIMARMLGGGETSRCPVAPAAVANVLNLLGRLGRARWQPTKTVLIPGEDRVFPGEDRVFPGDERVSPGDAPPTLPVHSAIIIGDTGPWYVDAASGKIGRARIRQTGSTKPSAPPPARKAASIKAASSERPQRSEPVRIKAAEPAIVELPPVPVLRLRRIDCPDESGKIQRTDALTVDFDYAGILIATEDDRQFVKVKSTSFGRDFDFIRRDRPAEAAALAHLASDGFTQMRLAEGTSARGRVAFVHRGRDAGERWQGFLSIRVPALLLMGWRNQIDAEFGPRLVQRVGDYDVKVNDSEPGSFSLDFGIEIDGSRIPLLPILTRLLDRGGMASAQVVDGEIITSLDDGRVLKLPADRIGRLLAVMGDLLDSARRTSESAIELPSTEAPAVLDLEDLLTTRWEDAGAIEAYAARFRESSVIPDVRIPDRFKASLRPYQLQGVSWMQHLREHGFGAFLADDMGLGKTAQTVAHIVIEHEQGRLDRPALIVVPTSLVTNWIDELTKFAPHLRTAVLHGIDRHAKRSELGGIHAVITTYTVLARDIEEMRELKWHVVVLDEAQVIKSPDAKATKAVCQLDTRHRICLSGTPIENNLQELWSEFAFLMPGLLGDAKGFTKRFRTPIEKNDDPIRRAQLIRRIKPFLLRRTKSEVAADLPPKHTILRHINLAPEQRELYETIRATLQTEVQERIAELGAAQSRIVMLDALLKLRQVCCDPRLVKLAAAREVGVSSKLDDLMEMVGEMIPEGRRILLFSQFTSMLDLIKPRLAEAGIGFVELRGDTRDRAEPVRAFEAGEVPLFLISLKAGGRGLNLTSADTVIHYDPWWNPAAEDQASDRAHRIGQTKSVFVYKMIAADTVEDRIVELQRRKADLANIALGEEGEIDGIDNDDLAFLFAGPEDRLAA